MAGTRTSQGPTRTGLPCLPAAFLTHRGSQSPSPRALLHRPQLTLGTASWEGCVRSPARTPRTRLDPQQASLTRWPTHPKIEAVEGGPEVAPGPQAVHLQGHLCEEETQENKLCKV